MSQAGQYNLLRLIKRQDKVAVTLALARFTEATISMPDAKSRRKVVILRNRIVETHALGAFAAKSCGNPLKEGRL